MFGKSVTCDNVTSKSGVLLNSKLTISECVLAPDLKVSTKPDQNEFSSQTLIVLTNASRPGLPGESSLIKRFDEQRTSEIY